MSSEAEIHAEPSIDLLVNDAIANLRKALADAGRRDLYVLIDPAMTDPVWALCESQGLPITRLNPPYGDVSAQVKPYLVTVSDEEACERFVNETIALAIQESMAARDQWPAPRSVSAWLIMDEHGKNSFIEGFAGRALLRQPGNASQSTSLRFWDPRVLPQLSAIVGQADWPRWMNATMTWLSVDPWGRLTTQQLSKAHGHVDQPWSCDQPAFGALARIAEVNQCLAMCGALWRAPDDRIYSHFDRLLLRAQQLGCSSPVDRVTYAAVADSMRLPLEQHPRIAAMLEQTRSGDASFSDLLSVLEPNDWDGIRVELTHSAHPHNHAFLAQV